MLHLNNGSHVSKGFCIFTQREVLLDRCHTTLPTEGKMCNQPGLKRLLPKMQWFFWGGNTTNVLGNNTKFQFNLETVERRATPRIQLKFPFIIYFVY